VRTSERKKKKKHTEKTMAKERNLTTCLYHLDNKSRQTLCGKIEICTYIAKKYAKAILGTTTTRTIAIPFLLSICKS
jgi:hypothetical protein